MKYATDRDKEILAEWVGKRIDRAGRSVKTSVWRIRDAISDETMIYLDCSDVCRLLYDNGYTLRLMMKGDCSYRDFKKTGIFGKRLTGDIDCEYVNAVVRGARLNGVCFSVNWGDFLGDKFTGDGNAVMLCEEMGIPYETGKVGMTIDGKLFVPEDFEKIFRAEER